MKLSSPESCGLPLNFGSHAVVLMPQRAVWWPDQQTVFIADTHFGKEATFRHAAIPVPDQTQEQLSRLDQVLTQTQARRLIVLGDLQHSRRGRCQTTRSLITEWRGRRPELEVRLIRGNHDVSCGDPPTDWNITALTPPFDEQGLCLIHDPDDVWSREPQSDSGTRTMAGHLHPAVRLSGRGRDSLRLCCFLLRRGVLVLPAFSSFVDSRVIAVEPDDRVFAVAEDSVVPVRV